MVADGLTKLGTAEVLQMVRDAMKGDFPAINLQPMPTIAAAHVTSVTPGKLQQWDVAGDGPEGLRSRIVEERIAGRRVIRVHLENEGVKVGAEAKDVSDDKDVADGALGAGESLVHSNPKHTPGTTHVPLSPTPSPSPERAPKCPKHLHKRQLP